MSIQQTDNFCGQYNLQFESFYILHKVTAIIDYLSTPPLLCYLNYWEIKEQPTTNTIGSQENTQVFSLYLPHFCVREAAPLNCTGYYYEHQDNNFMACKCNCEHLYNSIAYCIRYKCKH